MGYILHKSAVVICLIMFTASCGQKQQDADLPESLPNKLVPLDQNVGEPLLPEVISDFTSSVSEDPAPEFKLADSAIMLGALDDFNYDIYQKKWVGSVYPACNFFLITALCEAGFCTESKPFFIAAEFDIYLLSVGFVQTPLKEVKNMYNGNEKFDLVFQKQNPVKGKPGHVMVGVGYDSSADKIRVAQGSLGEISHEIKLVSNSFLINWQGGFNIFVRK